ncbi:MAG: hypothetical protein LC795_18090 [Acidobacteria bacterium]|nr:hypothetical protein [Acidobacteriota bacterium]
MRQTVAQTLLALACAASLLSCARAGGGGEARRQDLEAVVNALKALTDELAAEVESAQDTKAGVAEAQRLLDSRGGEMAARIDAFKKSESMRDPAARGRWLEAEVDNTQRVRELKLKYLDASLSDPALKAALERLAADYDSMFKDR